MLRLLRGPGHRMPDVSHLLPHQGIRNSNNSYLGCFKVQKYVTAFCFCLLNIQERLVSTKYGNGFKASQNKQSQCGAKSGVVDTDFFAPTHPPVGQKKSPVNFKQLTIRTALVQDIHLMIKKCVCTVKDF